MRTLFFYYKTKGFTLLELLVVIAIIAILSLLIVPTVGSILAASRLEQSALGIIADLDQARQLAVSRNRKVELRFLRFSDDPDPAGYRARQLFLIEENGTAIAQGPVRRFGSGVVIDPRPQVSSILDPSQRTERSSTLPLPGISENYSYFAMRFDPDGSTDLQPVLSSGGALWFLTLHTEWDRGDWTGTTLPDNFWTIQVDPASGAVQTHRP